VRESVYAAGRAIAKALSWIPFPERVRTLLSKARERLDLLHPASVYVAAALAVVITVRLVLAILRLPLTYGWQFFGWISGHDVSQLSLYNSIAQAVAFVVATKLAFEIIWRDEW
jgi:hypothetical protein